MSPQPQPELKSIVEFITVREYVDLRLNELEKRLVGERALLVASNDDRRTEMERRLTALNELRNEVLADRALFVTRDAFGIVADRAGASVLREYFDEQHRSLADKVALNTAAVANIRSRSAAYAAALGLAVTVLTAIILIIQVSHG